MQFELDGCRTTCPACITLTFDLPELVNVSNATSTHRGEQLCQIILKDIDLHKYRSSGPDISGWMHQGVHMDLH